MSISDRTKRLYTWIIEFHRSRTIVALFSSTEDERAQNFKWYFDNAKMISDFIGMIVRFSFANFATSYFLHRAPQVDGLGGWALGICFVFSFCISLVLGARILTLILLYESRNVLVFSNGLVRSFMAALTIITSLALWYGIQDLIRSLPKPAG